MSTPPANRVSVSTKATKTSLYGLYVEVTWPVVLNILKYFYNCDVEQIPEHTDRTNEALWAVSPYIQITHNIPVQKAGMPEFSAAPLRFQVLDGATLDMHNQVVVNPYELEEIQTFLEQAGQEFTPEMLEKYVAYAKATSDKPAATRCRLKRKKLLDSL